MSRALIQRVFPGLLRDVAARFSQTLRGEERRLERAHLQRLFDHCMGSGKFARSCLALDTYRALRPHATSVEVEQAAKVATSIEFLQSFFLVMDDVMDGGEVRRGKPCWHRMPGIGLAAINHALQLDLAALEVVREHMAAHPKRNHVIDEFHTTKILTVAGQNLDCATSGADACTWPRYDQLVRQKTSHYSYTLPLRLGFHMADHEGYEALTDLTYAIGRLFQAQDDYLDVFVDSSVTGKNATDISDGKCTWFSCRAMELIRNGDAPATIASQFNANFGRADAESIRLATAAMRALQLTSLFRDFEAAAVKELNAAVERVEVRAIVPLLANTVSALQGRKY